MNAQELEENVIGMYYAQHMAYAAVTMAHNRLSKIDIDHDNIEIARENAYLASVSMESMQMHMESLLAKLQQV